MGRFLGVEDKFIGSRGCGPRFCVLVIRADRFEERGCAISSGLHRRLRVCRIDSCGYPQPACSFASCILVRPLRYVSTQDSKAYCDLKKIYQAATPRSRIGSRCFLLKSLVQKPDITKMWRASGPTSSRCFRYPAPIAKRLHHQRDRESVNT